MDRIPDDMRLNEAEIRRVLQRASEIDGSGRSVTVAELRSIAAEVGITSTALTEALSDVFLTTTQPQPIIAGAQAEAAAEQKGRRFRDIVVGWREASITMQVAAGATLGVLQNVGARGIDETALTGAGVMAAATVFVALFRRRDTSDEGYVKAILPIWIGYIGLSLFGNPRGLEVGTEVTSLALAVSAISGAAGVVLSRWANRWRSKSSGGTNDTMHSASFSST